MSASGDTVVALRGVTGELMDEKAVLNQWPCLSKDGLRAARVAKTIDWVKGKQGKAWYRPSAVREFIETELEQKKWRGPGPDPSLNSPANGSPPIPKAPSCIGSGLSPELEEHAALASAQRIFTQQN